jgi:hypothetical protein
MHTSAQCVWLLPSEYEPSYDVIINFMTSALSNGLHTVWLLDIMCAVLFAEPELRSIDKIIDN